MESFERNPQIENKETNPEFHFREIQEIEPAVVSLVEQLKEKIDNGEYDTLISDDVGGRIPTLILSKIIKEQNPDNKIKTLFIASGKTYLPDSVDEERYKQLQEYLKEVTGTTQKALVVTQFIFTGKTLIRLAGALKEAGVNDFDIATVDAMPHFDEEEQLLSILGDNDLYIGSEDWHQLHERHEKLGGIRKTEEYSPFPKRVDTVIMKEGRDFQPEEWREIFGIEEGDSSKVIIEKSEDPERNSEFTKRTYAPLTSEEKEEIQRNINFAREDVKLLADRVTSQVWVK